MIKTIYSAINVFILLLFFSAQLQAANGIEAAAKKISFISCPVYRDADAGPKSGCWLATEHDSGRQFDISAGPQKPQLGKAVLVEGVITSDSQEFCGGITLQPVRVSVLDEVCPRHTLPAEGYPGRVFALPAELMQPLSVPRVLPKPPYDDKTYSILFNYNSSFLNYQYSEVMLEKIALYIKGSIKASQPKQVSVIGYSASETYSVSDRLLNEPAKLAEERADIIIVALTRLGIPREIIQKKTNHKPAANLALETELAEATKRRVDIVVDLAQ